MSGREDGTTGTIAWTASLETKAPEPSPFSDLINVCLDLVRGDLDTYVREGDRLRIEAALVAAGIPLPGEPEWEPSGKPAVTLDQSVETLKRLYGRGDK